MCQGITQNQPRRGSTKLTPEGNQRQNTTGKRRKKENRRAEERIVDLFNKDNFPSRPIIPKRTLANSQEPRIHPPHETSAAEGKTREPKVSYKCERKDTRTFKNREKTNGEPL
jgi:hypothetical protein